MDEGVLLFVELVDGKQKNNLEWPKLLAQYHNTGTSMSHFICYDIDDLIKHTN